MARRNTQQAPQGAKFTYDGLVLGLRKLDRRVKELEEFDIQGVTEICDPHADALCKRIDSTLAEILGSGTIEYRNYRIVSFISNLGSFWEGPEPVPVVRGKYEKGIHEALIKLKDMRSYLQEKLEDHDANPAAPAAPQTRGPLDKTKVFVVHGRNLQARDAMFSFLRAIGLHPIEWSEVIRLTENPNPFIGEILDSAFGHAQAILVLMTPDDVACLRPDFVKESDPLHERSPTPQARPNVLFEAGMGMGRSPDRTVLVELGEIRPFSDIGGRHVLRLNDSTQRRQELAQRLESAGCEVNLRGSDWHRVGDFQSSIVFSNTAAFPSTGDELVQPEPESDFAKLRALMPELFTEMKTDLSNDDTGLVREFFILSSKHVILSSMKQRLAYYEDEHPDLRNKVDLLDDHGFIIDVTTGNTPIYRMTKEFVELLMGMDD